MFDKLVESEPVGQVRSRRNYFVVSTLAMCVISLTAVVVSIFADDYSLNASLELAELIAPVEMAQVAPEQPQPRQALPRTQQASTLPTREIAMARVEDTRAVPSAISTAPNSHLSIPDSGRFTLGPDSNPGRDAGGVDVGSRGGTGSGYGLVPTVSSPAPRPEEDTPPPVVRRPEPPKILRSGGVLNGKAVDLPVPAYPAPAKAIGASGQVAVQVTLDESGKVISATAVSGNPLLRGAAVEAAKRARFTPTLLSNVPVKVTGIIVYNFNRG